MKTVAMGLGLIWVPVLALHACSATRTVIITGEAVDQAGQQFVLVSNAMQKGLAEGRVSKGEFKDWAEFSIRFDTFYGRGIDALKAARAIRDDIAARDLEAALGRLVVELLGHYRALQQAGLLKGAP